ncbi:hypothetical protein VSR01_16355 [Actinacidiphila sp. DG2A-62]|nr:hypothetical protein [Actinacidiphila sp. DG2A-62]MEC3995018.1 hypothetical protein [Actinacidiphila sp. DG2A-62]
MSAADEQAKARDDYARGAAQRTTEARPDADARASGAEAAQANRGPR